jgi:3-oxoacyl-[acyl-carrier protein] reductase
MPSSKRALITGAGAADGIGFAVARQLGLAGHAVFLNGASARVLDRAAALCAEGIDAKAAVADLTIAAEVARLRADVGAVDILVNNAGMGSLASPSADKAFLAMTEADGTRASPSA